ncbi:hypothetical protein JCM19240_2361 [Vibrio maritimus]|uniref:Contractile injection system tube protein N-terminal domain-containing protein n=1 Tax=Vibrio maritimus TaxID=990268 RepID=A0A090T0X2_9VIBR|nr:hypothetical protein JCM19240_2361 [Vibrio maritimus]
MVDKLKIVSMPSSGSSQTFTAMLNPNSIKHDFGIGYTDDPCKHQQSQGDIAPTVQFQGYQSEKLDFEIMIDATGVVEYTGGESVQDQLNQLKSVAYAYNGKQHEPNPVKITWGSTLSFRGRLTSMAVSYVLFDSSGVPLRATVTMNFTQFLTEQEKEALAKNRPLTSPTTLFSKRETHCQAFATKFTMIAPTTRRSLHTINCRVYEAYVLVPNSTFHHLVNGGIVWLNLLPSLTPTSLRLP